MPDETVALRVRLLPRAAWMLLFVIAAPCGAWDTPPHQQITKAALDALPKQFVPLLGSEARPLIEIYCTFPDRYEEMERYGFVRRSPGPQHASDIRVYCVRPDDQPVHGATGDRHLDTDSVAYLLDRIATNLSQKRPAEAARYAGVLSHFIADSLSPAHAVDADELLDMTPVSAQRERINIHSAIERSLPDFKLNGRGNPTRSTAKAIVDRCYAGAAQNRADLTAIVQAAAAHDERMLNVYRLRAGVAAAGILADALYTALDGH